MRLLTICNDCRRQYDASKLQPGSRFRCRCGEVVEVKPPQGHDASVVRCSSCGAPREQHAAACPHCEADFTLHERDLHTICPTCAARISDKAKFCHACGHAVTSTSVAGETTDLGCPACDDRHPLLSRQLGNLDVSASECDRCAGLWLGAECFESIVSKTNEQSLAECDLAAMKQTSPAAQAATTPEEPTGRGNWRYRRCPVCDDMMQRRNYARKSGVMLDVCRTDGVWFDAHELHQILVFIKEGGLARADKRRAESERYGKQTQRILEAAREHDEARGAAVGGWLGRSSSSSGAGFDLVTFAVASIFDF